MFSIAENVSIKLYSFLIISFMSQMYCTIRCFWEHR